MPACFLFTHLLWWACTGAASTYNPYRRERRREVFDTSSGEHYDPNQWTAAIQIDLRWLFNGVRYGANYKPTFALVEYGKKAIIVKINDVGPLKPGRVIDLNERAMHYFDPSMKQGVLRGVKVTVLPGDNWTTGPIG